jgi:hypothetical protein
MSESFSSAGNAVEWLICKNLPEFCAKGKKPVAQNAKTINFRRQRKDGIFERILIELNPHPDRSAIGFQIATNVFSECPTIGGPFGYSSSLPYLVEGGLAEELRTYWYSNSWFEVQHPLRSGIPFFELMGIVLRGPVRSRLDEWANKLLSDETLKIAVGTFDEIVRSGEVDKAEEILGRRLDGCVTAYPIEKIKRQLLFRLRGNKNWYLF